MKGFDRVELAAWVGLENQETDFFLGLPFPPLLRRLIPESFCLSFHCRPFFFVFFFRCLIVPRDGGAGAVEASAYQFLRRSHLRRALPDGDLAAGRDQD